MSFHLSRLGRPYHRRRRAFTLTELLVVIGLIALLVSLLLPVISRARAAANATACLSNLRQMGTAWTMYTAENRGRLMDYVWRLQNAPDIAWQSYWPGVLEHYKVRGETILCPAASDPIPYNYNDGYGNVAYAWSGKYQSPGTVAKFNAVTYRHSSYGFNRYLTSDGGFGMDGRTSTLASVRPSSDVPLFADAVFADFKPDNGSPTAPVAAPPNLRGEKFTIISPQHWRFLIARHGRGVNVCFADGSTRWVPLEEMYMLTWKAGWLKYRLPLPKL